MRRSILLLSLLSACADGQVKPLTQDADARILGRALEDAQAAADLPIYVVRDGQRIASTRTDADGAYVFTDVLPGPVTVVAHDGHGRGALQELTVYSGGDNRVSDLTLGPLALDPRVLSLQGVGFEERIASLASARTFVTLHDGDAIIRVPEDGPFTPGELIRLDVETGEETPLFDGAQASFVWMQHPSVFQSWNDNLTVFDLDQNRVLYDGPGQERLQSSKPNDDGMVVFERRTPIMVRRYAENVRGAPFPSDYDYPNFLQVVGGRHFFLAEVGSEELALASLDVETAALVEHTRFRYTGPRTVQTVEATDAAYLVSRLLDEPDRILRLDLVAGEVETAYTATGQLIGLGVHDEEVVTLEKKMTGVELVYLSPEGTRTQAVTYQTGTREAACFEGRAWSCFIISIAANHQRLVIVPGPFEEPRDVVYADLVDGAFARVIGRPSGLTPQVEVPTFFPVGARELTVLTDPSTSFTQINVGPPGAPVASLDRRTSLRSNHHSPQVTEDGKTIYYVAADPVSAEEALFRVSFEALD